jgi:drug/metabolite transporter (DMT)-like permease
MQRRQSLYWLIGVNVIWGSTYVVAKAAMETVPPPLLVALRFTLATTLLWTILLLAARNESASRLSPLRGICGADRSNALGFGLLGVGAGYLLAYWGVNLTTATDAALMIIGEVIFTSVLAALVAGERIGRWRGFGLLLGALGVLTLVLGNAADLAGDQRGSLRAVGDLLVLCGIFCESLYTVFGARLARRVEPLVLIAYAYAGSMVVWAPIILWHLVTGQFPTLNWQAGLGILYLAVLPSVLCHLVWFSIIRRSGAGIGAVSLLVQPVVGALLGILLLREPMTAGLIAGAGLIFVALYLTALPEQPASSAQAVEETLG